MESLSLNKNVNEVFVFFLFENLEWFLIVLVYQAAAHWTIRYETKHWHRTQDFYFDLNQVTAVWRAFSHISTHRQQLSGEYLFGILVKMSVVHTKYVSWDGAWCNRNTIWFKIYFILIFEWRETANCNFLSPDLLISNLNFGIFLWMLRK